MSTPPDITFYGVRSMRWRRRRPRRGPGTISFQIPPYKRRKFLSLLVLGLFFLSLWLSFWLVDVRLRPSLHALALAQAKAMAVTAVNEAVIESGASGIKYQELVSIKTDERGRPVLLQPDMGRLNALAAEITLHVQQALRGLPRTSVRLPLGPVLGTQMLGSSGPRIGVALLPMGTVESRVVDSFTAAGINQTRHRILVRVQAEVKVVVPLVSATAKTSVDVPLAEAVIMGEVPGVFLDGTR